MICGAFDLECFELFFDWIYFQTNQIVQRFFRIDGYD